MAGTFNLHSWAIKAPVLVLFVGLSACSGRNTVVAEQVMEAKQAAERAEAAQKGAEQALARIARNQPASAETVVVEQEQPDGEPGADVKPDVDTEASLNDS